MESIGISGVRTIRWKRQKPQLFQCRKALGSLLVALGNNRGVVNHMDSGTAAASRRERQRTTP